VSAPLNLRGEGRARILRALHGKGPASRPRLVALTGLSRATVASLVADLIDEGVVREDGVAKEAGNRPNGRPAQTLSVVPQAAYAAGADIGHAHVHVVLCDLAGHPVWDRRVAYDTDLEPARTLSLVAESVAEALAGTGVAATQVLGLGVGIACPVDGSGDGIDAAGIMPGWLGVRPATELSALTGLSTELANDANAGALGERLYGAGRGVDDLVYIRLSAGIGAGVISAGRLITGSGGLAGEVGHLPVAPGGLVCRCGNRGCLETVASPAALADLLSRSWRAQIDPADLPGVFTEARAGVRVALQEAGEAVGRALATMVTLLDPRLVIIGGDLACAGEALLDPIRRTVERYAMPTGHRKLDVVAGELSARAEVLGAAGMIINAAPDTLALR
jgi:predicted NBD/HSP70 family sugar kinase